MKSRYRIYCDDFRKNSQVVIDIEDNIMTQQGLIDINNLWLEHEHSMINAHGFVLFSVLKIIAEEALYRQPGAGYNTKSIIKSFEGVEGLVKMDGSQGIEIISVQGVKTSPDDMTIQTLKTTQ